MPPPPPPPPLPPSRWHRTDKVEVGTESAVLTPLATVALNRHKLEYIWIIKKTTLCCPNGNFFFMGNLAGFLPPPTPPGGKPAATESHYPTVMITIA